MTLKGNIKRRQIPIYIFMLFYCYLFVFQYILRSYIDEAVIIISLPFFTLTLSGRGAFSLKKYMLPAILMLAFILVWSTEAHQSFIYYFIMVEALLFVRLESDDFGTVINIIKATALVNAFSVVVSRLFPGLMAAYARLVFAGNIADGYIKLMQRGYYSGLNNQVAFSAAYIALGIMAYVYDKRGSCRSRIAKAAFLCVSLILTNKRSHLIFLLIALFAVYYLSGNKNKRVTRGIKIAFIAVGSVGALFIAAFLFPTLPVLNRLASLLSVFISDGDVNSALSGRVAIYKQVLDLFMSNKMFGIGWQNFADFSAATSVSGGVNQGHNVILQLLCETGIVGSVLFLSINLYYLLCNLRINALYVKGKCNIAEEKDRLPADAGIKYSAACMIFYYLFWLSGNAFYDFTFVYTWVIAILIGQSLKESI